MIERLRTNPFLLRELALRAAADDSRRLYAYSGPGLFLLLLQMPVLYGLLVSALSGSFETDIFGAPMFLVTAWFLVLYFSHAAARLCAGALSSEREGGTLDALRLLPHASGDLFVGKFLGALAPLAIEVLLVAPALSLYALVGPVPLIRVALVAMLCGALVVGGGAIGMFWSVQSSEPGVAVTRAFATVLTLHVVPCALAVGLLSMSAGGESLLSVVLLSPLALVVRLAHAGSSTLSMLVDDLTVLAPVMCLGGCVTVLLLQIAMRRLSRG